MRNHKKDDKTGHTGLVKEKKSLEKIYVLHKKSGGSVGLNKPDCRVNGEALHQPFKLKRRDRPCFQRSTRPDEPTAFNTFRKKEKAIPFPDQTFDFVGAPAAEKEKGTWDEQGKVKFTLNNRCRGIHPEAHIGKTADDIDGME